MEGVYDQTECRLGSRMPFNAIQDSRFKIFIHSNHLPWYIEDHKISTH